MEHYEEAETYVKSADDLEKKKETTMFCSFCGKGGREIRSMIASPVVLLRSIFEEWVKDWSDEPTATEVEITRLQPERNAASYVIFFRSAPRRFSPT